MKIINYGSINVDLVYAVDHFPQAGETIVSNDFSRGLGGKGANMSIAAAATRADIRHFGAVGHDGLWARDALGARGVDVSGVAEVEAATGHAIIQVDAGGENVITLYSGANTALPAELADRAVASGERDDWLLLQNETAHVERAARAGRERGLQIAYAAAPFDTDAALAVLPHLDLIALNAVEAAQLEAATGRAAQDLDIARVLVTRGGDGATLYAGGGEVSRPAIPTNVVDTTGAGDTFLGVFLGALAQGRDDPDAMELALRAAAIQVSRPGAADAIPTADELETAR